MTAGTPLPVHIRIQESGSGAVCRSILDALPHWFGIPASVQECAAAAKRCPSVIAAVEDEDVGIATLVRHSPDAAEVFVMGVLPRFHRHGIGGRMLRTAERWLAASGVVFLQVKTLGPSKEDEGYARTRAFYLAYGFRHLEEFPLLWDADNPALQLIKVVKPGNSP